MERLRKPGPREYTEERLLATGMTSQRRCDSRAMTLSLSPGPQDNQSGPDLHGVSMMLRISLYCSHKMLGCILDWSPFSWSPQREQGPKVQ